MGKTEKSELKVDAKNVGPCRKRLRIEVTADAARAEYDRAIRAFQGAAKIPGFRRGKAPEDLVARRYEKQIAEEVRDRLLPRYYHEALEEKGLRAVGVVDVSESTFVKGEPFSFAAVIDVDPEFKLPKYRGLSLKGTKIEVGEEEVARALETLRERAASFLEVSGRPVASGDFVQLDYAGLVDGKPVRELAPDRPQAGEGKDFWLSLEPDASPFLPASLLEGLVGLEVGGAQTLDATFPADYAEKALAGKKAVYTVQVKAIRERILPEVNAEFAKLFGADSVEALHEQIRTRLRTEAEQAEKARLRNEIVNRLLAKTKMDLPESLVQRETQSAARTIVRQSAGRGATQEQLEARKEEILSTARQSSETKVRLDYVLSGIAQRENITVAEQEVQQRVATLAAAYRVPVERLKTELENGDGLDKLRQDIVCEKTLDFILENAKISK